MDNTVAVQVHTDMEQPTVAADTAPRRHGRKKTHDHRTNRPPVGQDPKFDEMYQQLAVMQKQLNTMKKSMLAARTSGKLQTACLAVPESPPSVCVQ